MYGQSVYTCTCVCVYDALTLTGVLCSSLALFATGVTGMFSLPLECLRFPDTSSREGYSLCLGTGAAIALYKSWISTRTLASLTFLSVLIFKNITCDFCKSFDWTTRYTPTLPCHVVLFMHLELAG